MAAASIADFTGATRLALAEPGPTRANEGDAARPQRASAAGATSYAGAGGARPTGQGRRARGGAPWYRPGWLDHEPRPARAAGPPSHLSSPRLLIPRQPRHAHSHPFPSAT